MSNAWSPVPAPEAWSLLLRVGVLVAVALMAGFGARLLIGAVAM